MSKYLSEEYIINPLDSYLADSRGAEHFAYNVIKLDMIAAPGIEIKHGNWIMGLDGSYMCSECGKVHRYEIGNYCSVCGAKLEYEE